MKILCWFFVITFSSSLYGQPTINDLMPMPQSVEIGVGKYRIENTFKVKVEGNSTTRVNNGVSRMVKRLAGRTGFFLPQVFFNKDDSVNNADLNINISRQGSVKLGENESYNLIINNEQILLEAETDIGALRGLETFLQLLDSDDKGYFVHAVEIKDNPRFPWRGLLIDVCRHFEPIDVLKRNLDGMAAVKMNVFHWHLSENQAFRIESKVFPELHKQGSNGYYYTQEEVKDLVKYAENLGIRVIPEFDLPGHATSWFVGYPKYASAPATYKLQDRFGIFSPVFNPTLEETYIYIDKFFEEICKLFPDEYIHIGGDENNGKHWDSNQQIQQFMKDNGIKNNFELQTYFNFRLLKILTKYNKKMVGWDEILQLDMPKNIVIQSWRGKESMIKAAEQGYQTILSNGYYIDLIQPTDFHYLNDPLPSGTVLTEKQRKLILGGEATMWGEMVASETIDSRIWPRTAAIAERLWSSGSQKDVNDMYRRLKIVSYQLEELGLTHEKNYPFLLRRLTKGKNTEPLKILVDIIEPVKIYKRDELLPHYTYTQMSRVVDAARPDAEVARNFRKLVNKYINDKDAKSAVDIISKLNIWKENDTELSPIIMSSPILWEIESLSKDLTSCSKIGLEAISIISNKRELPNNWASDSWKILQKSREPRGQTELMIIPAIEKLVDLADPDFSKVDGDNKLSGKEKVEGWQLLFDGKTSNGWRAYGKENFPKSWEVKDGMLHSIGSEDGKDGGGNDLLTSKEYEYFELSLEWKISEGANSGIFYLCQERDGDPIYKSNLQMQILDNERNPDAKKGIDGNRLAGSLWDLIQAIPQNTKPVGKWNRVKISVNRDGQIIHNQNGVNVVEYYPWYDEWQVLIAHSSYKDNPFFVKPAKKGFVGLQEHGTGVWFKNIKIREL